MALKKALLIFSFLTIVFVGSLYGVSPGWFFGTFLESPQPITVDQSHIMRAVMTLYFGFGCFWLWCAFSEKYRDVGIVTLAIVCGGLMTGRLISLLFDGIPSPLLVYYTLIELAIVPICIWLLRRPG